MLLAKIKKGEQVLDQQSAETVEELNSILQPYIDRGIYGAPRFSLQLVEVSPAVLESQEVLDEEGQSFDPPQFQDVEVSPAVFEEQSVETNPEGYVISIVDISAQLAQEAINTASLKYLAETDYIVVRAAERNEELSAEFKAQREAARAAIVR